MIEAKLQRLIAVAALFGSHARIEIDRTTDGRRWVVRLSHGGESCSVPPMNEKPSFGDTLEEAIDARLAQVREWGINALNLLEGKAVR